MSIHTVYTQLKNDDLVIYKSFNLLVHKLVTVDHSKTRIHGAFQLFDFLPKRQSLLLKSVTLTLLVITYQQSSFPSITKH